MAESVDLSSVVVDPGIDQRTAADMAGTPASEPADIQAVASPVSSRRVHCEAVRLLYRGSLLGLSSNPAMAVVVVVMLWPVLPHSILIAWAILVVAVTLFRICIMLAFRYLRPGDAQIARWATAYIIGTAFQGGTWGAAGVLFVLSNSVAHQAFMSFILGGIAAGALVTNSAVWEAYLAFVAPALLGPSLGFFAQGTDLFIAMGAAGLMFMVFLILVSRQLNRTLKRSLTLGIQNTALFSQLADALQQARLASAAKSDFVANMSHEIRTPLNTVIGVGDLLAETALNAEQLEYVTLSRHAGESLLCLINDILDLSKVEANQLVLESIAFDLDEILDACVAIQQLNARQKGIRLESRVDDDVPRRLIGDPTRLRQVLLNLVSNAVKFTREGGVALNVTRALDEAGEQVLQFCVEDTGIGIPEERQANVFNIFYQVDSSTTRAYGGTGLGLAISKRIVELMGGWIRVESRTGEGSRFLFAVSLPEAPALPGRHATKGATPCDGIPGTEAAVRSKRVAEPDGAPGERRVLLVDDNPDGRLLVQAYLRTEPYVVDTAENGREAVDMVRGGAYDLVLMDMQMPVMDGLTATREIRSHESAQGTVPVPIIAFTANALREDVENSLAAGCTSHLAKPVKKDALLKALEAMFSASAD